MSHPSVLFHTVCVCTSTHVNAHSQELTTYSASWIYRFIKLAGSIDSVETPSAHRVSAIGCYLLYSIWRHEVKRAKQIKCDLSDVGQPASKLHMLKRIGGVTEGKVTTV